MGLDPVSAIFGGLSSSAQALWNQKEKGRDRQYATKMSNTAHQREVADLRAAGLNPILSAGGSGASTPSIGSVPAPDVAGNIAKLTQSSTGKQLATSQVKKIDAEATSAKASADVDKGMADLYNRSPGLKFLVDLSNLTSRSGMRNWITSAGTGILNSAKALLNLKKGPSSVVNKTINNRNHTVNQKIGGWLDTETGELLPNLEPH